MSVKKELEEQKKKAEAAKEAAKDEATRSYWQRVVETLKLAIDGLKDDAGASGLVD